MTNVAWLRFTFTTLSLLSKSKKVILTGKNALFSRIVLKNLIHIFRESQKVFKVMVTYDEFTFSIIGPPITARHWSDFICVNQTSSNT